MYYNTLYDTMIFGGDHMKRDNIITLRLSESEVKKLDFASQLFNIKKSMLIRKAVGEYLKFIEFESEVVNDAETE